MRNGGRCDAKYVIKGVLSNDLIRYRFPRSGGVYFSFDDGPHPQFTPEILAILDRYGVKGTFFLIGANIERHPDLVRNIVGGGHTVGSHLYSHRSAREMSPAVLDEEIDKTDDVLVRATGRHPRLLRPPYGHVTTALLWKAYRGNRSVVLWSVDSDDSFLTSAEEVVDGIRAKGVRRGDILLFHEDCRHTVEALPDVIENLIREGHTTAPIRA